MKSRRPRAPANHDRWLISYSDFMTLLFALFVVLYVFSKADQKKQLQIKQSVDSAFRALSLFPSSPHDADGSAADPPAPEAARIPANGVMADYLLSPADVKFDLNRMQRQLEQDLSPQLAAHTVSLHMGKDGLVITLREAGFFSSGSAVPNLQTLPTLRRIAASLNRTPYDLRVEGHTDNAPIHTQEFDSNWELSSDRATRIARLLLDLKALPPDRISAAGYAEFHPVASNLTAEGRSLNRRVDLLVLPRSGVDLSAPSPASHGGAWRKITENSPATGPGL